MSEIINPGGGGGSSGLTVGTTTITGGTSGDVLIDNAGILGEIPSTVLIPAPSNLTWYVAATGSDSNPGTIGSPFLTIQHAANQVLNYIFNPLYSAKIVVANGTYNEEIVCPPYFGTPLGGYVLVVGNEASPTSVVLTFTGTPVSLANLKIIGSAWGFSGMQLTNDPYLVWGVNGAQVWLDNIDFLLTANVYNALLFQNYSTMNGQINNALLSLSGSAFAGANIFAAYNFSNINLAGDYTITVNATVSTTQGVFLATTFSQISAGAGGGWVNPANITGPTATLTVYGSITTDGSSLTTLPGNGQLIYDSVSSIAATNYNYMLGLDTTAPGPPTTAELDVPKGWGIFKDNSGGGVYLAYNDAGTIKLTPIPPSGGGGGGPPLIIF